MSEARVREVLSRIQAMLDYGLPPILRNVGLSESEAQQLDKEGIIRLGYAGIVEANKHKEFLDRYVVVEISDKARAWLVSHPPPLPSEDRQTPRKPAFARCLLWLVTTPKGWITIAVATAAGLLVKYYLQKHFH